MQESQSNLSSNECMFCVEEAGAGFTIMMSQALQSKHAINKYQNYSAYIDVLLRIEEPCTAAECWEYFQYKEYLVQDEQQQFMKKEYEAHEFEPKIGMLTEYYKFHSNIPRIIEPKIQKILGKYYDKKREYDYKKIKKLLKEEQGLSITSVQESQSSMEDSMIQKKSRYSTLLDQLQNSKFIQEMTDSKLLKDMCKQIEKVLPSNKHDKLFEIKGAFGQDKMFEHYLKQQQVRFRQKMKQRNNGRLTVSKKPNRLNLQQLLKKGRQRSQKDTISSNVGNTKEVKESRQMKRKQKDKFIYNTNIKIEIKNAMFYSNGEQPLQMGNIQYDDNKMENRFKKKNFFTNLNLYNTNQTNKKNLMEIYKPHQQDVKRKSFNSNSKQRVITKESINNSHTKERKKTIPKEQSQQELKRGVSGALSARKIVYSTNQWNRSKSTTKHDPPTRKLSTGNLKKRSLSTNNGFTNINSGFSTSTTSINKRNERIIEKRPIQSISRYGSSDMKTHNNNQNANSKQKQAEMRAISIKDILNRKLTLKFS